jgi:hypothetical protein
VYCQVQVSVADRFIAQRSPTEPAVSERDREVSIMKKPWPTRGCSPTVGKIRWKVIEQSASLNVILKLRLRMFQSAFNSASTKRVTFQEKDTEITVLYNSVVQSDIHYKCKQHLTGTSYFHFQHTYPEEVKNKIFPKYYYICHTHDVKSGSWDYFIEFKRQQKTAQHDP